ncbi:MAG: TatD family hydrolase [Ferruginibacter sp.]
MIDTHSHLYLEEFEKDIEDVISRAQENGIQKIFLPSISRNEHQRMLDLAERFQQICFPMIGLHPCYVKENYLSELNHVKDSLVKNKFYAIGEVGLDFYWDKTFVKEQYAAFEFQIELAISNNLPVIIHSRESTKECVNIIKNYASRGVKGIFHCFGGSLEEANEIIELGFYIGIGGVVTYKNSGLAKVLNEVSINNIVLETDAPYLSPVPYRGKRNESSYLYNIAQKLSEIKNISMEEIDEITTSNALKVFSI